MEDIKKAGEGSRGGTIIGHTASGKAIYRKSSHESHKTFSPEDHKQAANLHQDIYDRAQKKIVDKRATDSKFKPDQKVYDFLQHHHRQAAVHTGGASKPRNVSPESKAAAAKKKPAGAKVDEKHPKEGKPSGSEKQKFKSQFNNKVVIDTINRLRGEGKTAEARRIYDNHFQKAHSLLEALGKGGAGSGKKGHHTVRSQMTSGTSANRSYDFNTKFKHAPVNKDIEVSSDSSIWHTGNIPKGSKISNLPGGVHVKFPQGHAKENHGHKEYGVKVQSHENNLNSIKEGLNKSAAHDLLEALGKSENLAKAKYIRRTGTSGNYKYYYDKPKQDQKQLLKEAFGKQITFSGPGGKEYSAHVYSEPDEEGKIILKFPSHGYRRIELASIKNPVITEPGPIVAPGSITKYGSLGWPPSGFKEPERKGNKTTEKLWHKLGVEGQEGRPDTTGKLSSPKNQYMSPIGSKCNLVGNVAFGKASDLAQRQLNQKLQMTEVLLTDMGIKLKTPIDFICQDMENGQRGVMAQFLPMNQHRNDKINLAKNLATVNKSLLHEIGHGIDYAMEQKGMAGSYFRGNPGEFKEELGELTEILRNSKFYEATGAKDAPGNINDDFLEPDDRFANYLKDESEVFARAFEVYTLNHAQEMVSEGKLPKEYVENFVPDYLKAGFTQRTVEPEAYDKTMDAVTRVMDKIFRNRAIQKAMKNIDLLETLRKNVVSTDDQGSATETGMYSNDLYSNASNPLMDLIRDSIQDNDFSGDPVRILIAPDTIFTCTKDTDGVYSGTVNKNNENVLKIEKQTLPTLLQMLKIKELIPVEVEEPEKEEPADDYKMKVLDLLGKLL